ncbi:hypothetical protein LEMLEM_LOCUS21491 [Lemmus lemmus]
MEVDGTSSSPLKTLPLPCILAGQFLFHSFLVIPACPACLLGEEILSCFPKALFCFLEPLLTSSISEILFYRFTPSARRVPRPTHKGLFTYVSLYTSSTDTNRAKIGRETADVVAQVPLDYTIPQLGVPITIQTDDGLIKQQLTKLSIELS